MITKKEDLHFTYVKNKPELREAFIEKCDEFGVEVFNWKDSEPYLEVCGDDDGAFKLVGVFHLEPQSKELTLSDLKPRTKTEYELLCNSSFNVWGLKDLLESGSLFYFINDEYRPVSVGSDIFAIEHFLSGHIFRKVEIEIDERQEFVNTYASLRYEFHGQRTYDDFSGFMFDSGKFKLVE